MINLYCTLIINKKRKITDIPTAYQAIVVDHLKDMGYTPDGDIIRS